MKNNKRGILILMVCFIVGMTGIGFPHFKVKAAYTENFQYEEKEDGTLCITAYRGDDTDVIFPEEIEGKKVTGIGEDVFIEFFQPEKIVIPASVTEIDENAFMANFWNLNSIIVDSKNTVYDSRNNCNALIETKSNRLILGSNNTQIPDGIKSIADYAFNARYYFDVKELPDGITHIGKHAFCRTNLTSIKLPKTLTSVEEGAFSGCWKLTNIELFEGITSIGESTFADCGMTEMMIPNTVSSIGEYAFDGCSKMVSLHIPAGVTEIGETAFRNCTGLMSITVDSKNAVFDSRDECNAIIHTQSNTIIRGCDNTVFPDGIIRIGETAFSGCEKLVTIEIPEGVEEIGYGAFDECSNLAKVKLPASLKSIGEYAFGWDEEYIEFETEPGSYAEQWVQHELPGTGEYQYTLNEDGTICIESYEGRDREVVIPEKIDGKTVTGIGVRAFDWNENLITVEIPATIKSIGDSAFRGCSELTDVKILADIMHIESAVFAECSSLTKFEIPQSVTSIGDYAFNGCENLKSIVIPENVVYIDNRAFSNLDSISVSSRNMVYDSRNDCNAVIEKKSNKLIVGTNNTIIPNDVVGIGTNAFSDCSDLKNIQIPSGVTYIERGAFRNTGLTHIDIPKNLKCIEESVFANCEGLSDIVIPQSVTQIGFEAFYGCDNLVYIEIPASVTVIGYDTFRGCPENLIIVTQSGSYAETWAKKHEFTVKTSSEDPAHTHQFSTEWTIDQNATCGASGSKSHHCTGCSEKTDTTVIPATGEHTYGEWTVTQQPTGDKKGVKTRKCKVCNKEETEEIPATGNGENQSPEQPVVEYKEGTDFNKGNASYEVVYVDGNKGTVIYTGTNAKNKKTITVPKTVTVEGKTFTVTEIADNAFKSNTKVTNITVSANITKIGKNSFSGCKNLKKITIKSTMLKKVGKNAFKGINKKAVIKVPKKQLAKYKKLFKGKGLPKTVKIK